MSTPVQNTSGTDQKQSTSNSPKKHRKSTNKNVEANGSAQKQSTTSSRTLSNGSHQDFEYFSDPFDLEEPFSESDDDEPKKTAGMLPAKPRLQLPLPRYVEHWRQRFAKDPLETLFPKIEPPAGDELHGRTPHYFLISDATNIEDRSIREKLAMRRLEEVLLCQQREREDRFFSQQCLFCRYTARGNRAKLIHHLYMVHHLNLGSPDNLVFVAEYMDILRDRLNRNECLYCEKSYVDRQSLMEHMRKRGHREELGKKWLDVLAEDFEDQMPHFVDSDEEAENESWHEWLQDSAEPEEERTAMCLFCNESDTSVQELLGHVKEVHGFDVVSLFEQQSMGFYERVKFINYLRKKTYECHCPICGAQQHNTADLKKHLTKSHTHGYRPKRKDWDRDEYLVPMFENDHLLWMLESHLESKSARARTGSESVYNAGGDANSNQTISSTQAISSTHQSKARSYSTAQVAGHPVGVHRLRGQVALIVKDPLPESSVATPGARTHLASVTECACEPCEPGVPVFPEDMPDLKGSALDEEMLEQLK